MTAPLVGRRVTISGLAAKPELNGRHGVALSFNDESGRYNVALDHSAGVLALKAVNVLPAAKPAPPPPRGGGIPQLSATHAAVAAAAVLVWWGVSLLNAALLCTLGLLVHSAARREGGLAAAGRTLLGGVARAVHRLSGHQMSLAQAAALLAAVAYLVWSVWLRDASGGAGRYDTYAQRGGGYGYASYGSGWGAGWDLSFMISAAMLATMVYQLGGGRNGWSVGELVRRVQNMDFWQMMMFANLLQTVFGGGRRGGGYHGMGGFRRRGMYF